MATAAAPRSPAPQSGEPPVTSDRPNSTLHPLDRPDDISQVLLHNPLLELSDDQLHDHAAAFYESGKLKEVVEFDVFLRGARIAKNPTRFESVEGLTDIELTALHKEHNATFWQQVRSLPKEFRIILATCCFAAIVQGWNQSNLAGANLFWPAPKQSNQTLAGGERTWSSQTGLGLAGWNSSTLIDPFHDEESVRAVFSFGAINAASYIAAAIIGSQLSDPLCEYAMGRRGALMIAAIFSFAAAVGGGYVTTIGELALCRVLTGIGMGAKASIVPIFAAETAPHNIRGSLVITWQTFDAFGIMLGYAANLVVLDSWRKQIASAFIPAIPLLILVPLCVESPRWLYKKNKVQESYMAFKLLRDTPVQACRDLYYCHAQLQVETQYFRRHKDPENGRGQPSRNGLPADIYFETTRQTMWFSRMAQLFFDGRTRRATLQAFLVMMFQQASGINCLAFLAPTVFGDALQAEGRPLTPSEQRAADIKALWMSFGFGVANFLFTWPAWRTIDKKGRRYLLNLSLWNMSWTMLALGLSFLIPASSSARIPTMIVFVLLFTLAYSPGAGPLAFTISAEVFPLINREVGMSLSVFVNLMGAGMLALLVPILAKALTHTGLLCMFAGFNVICGILAFFLIRETATYSLEDLNQIFEIPTKTHVQYQWYRVVRVFRRSSAQSVSECDVDSYHEMSNYNNPIREWAAQQRPEGLGFPMDPLHAPSSVSGMSEEHR